MRKTCCKKTAQQKVESTVENKKYSLSLAVPVCESIRNPKRQPEDEAEGTFFRQQFCIFFPTFFISYIFVLLIIPRCGSGKVHVG